MKELSIEEKARRYDEAIEELRGLLEGIHEEKCEIMEEDITNIFPELKESESEDEEERIRNYILSHFQEHLNKIDEFIREGMTAPFSSEEIKMLEASVAWLEKQGEPKEYTFKSIPRLLDMIEPTERAKVYCQKLIDTFVKEGYSADAKIVEDCLKQMNGEVVAMAVMDEKQGEQKPADKVEPKFEIEEGKWYVCTQTYTLRGKIVAIKGQTYKSNQNGAIEVEDGHLFIDKIDGKALNYFKPWTIQDAKDGDVLATEDWVFIFKKMNPNKKPTCYCHYDIELGFHIDTNSYIATGSEIHPATKEQRDLLFQKMHEAGYEWDAERKELRKIEQKSAWSEEDWDYYAAIIAKLEVTQDDALLTDNQMDFLKSLKERVQPLPNDEWSEEDRTKLQDLIDLLKQVESTTNMPGGLSDYSEWLKSLRPQSQWKPSEEQMEALDCVTDYGAPAHRKALKLLYDDLKKLTE